MDEMLFNPLDPGYAADPYPTYRRLRELDPVHHSPFGIWVLSRHEDCHTVLRHHAASSDQRKGKMFRDYVAERPLTAEEQALADAEPMLFRDPPDHTRLRRLASAAFTAKVVEQLRPRIHEIVDGILDRLDDEFDVISEVAYPVPVRVIGELLGVPEDDHAQLKEWSSLLVSGLGVQLTAPTASEDDPRIAAGDAFNRYFKELIAERHRNPGEDLLSRLVLAEEAGDKLSEGELLTTCVLLLIAGHETTANLIGNGLLALLQQPDQLDRLRSDPSLARTAVEELLRFDSPVQLTARTATEPIDLGGTTIDEGEMMLVLLGAANRDPEQFTDPDRLDVGRAENRHLAFGSGIHLCLGVPLARLEGEIVLTSLLERRPELRLASDDHDYRGGFVLRGLKSLRVRG